ncbi:MAG: ABC transporter ATP-binding protein [Euryarchaeota archaeon]|jgi:ABC-2 type transport system ATP-binding protein|nr:ABC transporter ATP-binding protein [Euryarchaeota archaeon]MBT4391837.1 ABC transporter ATP-binding protein [Euryarchaeota archaeon]MBT4802993.1 ABC transporter ATP-binding protein [Euryarchaeota archaeon]MBT5614583.1 ABC transporter ATP-binding protein [Euryarchaeota archaeon]MBT6683463.1 ABC transporter ATP-binding protein [Euryarchaeota archaeon]
MNDINQKPPSVLLENVSKWYGEVIGINDISLAIEGGVTGILGPNGAGKSTLFKLLMGRLKPSQGTVRLFGIDPWKSTSPYRRIGYVSESERMYDWMTSLDFISTLARLHGMSRDEAIERSKHVLDFVGLEDVHHKEIGKYSKGMRQRVKIAHALVHDPDLIILDEPLHGCDPIARTSIMSVVRELGSQGKTVLISSHILEEIERITEQIVILHNGKLLAIGNLHAIRDLLDQHPHRILIKCDSPRELAQLFITEEPVYGVRFPEDGQLEIQTNNLSAAHGILPSTIVKSGQKITSIENPDDNLDSLIGYLLGGINNG